MTRAGRHRLSLLLLLALPALAHAPAWLEGRLLGSGDAAALHYPLRAAAWQAWRAGDLPAWNPWTFSGMPLLASYRAGALYPPALLLAPLPPFWAFQLLVLASLGAAGALTALYLRRLQSLPVGAYAAGLCFALGPYLVGHLSDTAAIVAAPTLPLLLLAAESHMNRATAGRAAGLAAALALNLLAGSPEATRAGAALLAGRLLIGYAAPGSRRPPPWRLTLLAVGAGLALAAPQVLPTLLAMRDAGRQVTGLAGSGPGGPAGLSGLILRYVSHTPAPALALAALPLMLRNLPARVLAASLVVALALQWGRGPLSAPGGLALVFDFTLAALAGLSLSEQWRLRHEPLGRRLRAYLLVSCLASAAVLSIAAAALGPLPQSLAGAVGVLAIAQVLFFAAARSGDPVVARSWLLPLTASFLLQPHAREVWREAPTARRLEEGTPTAQAVSRALLARPRDRVLTLVRDWPRDEADDLGFTGETLLRRASANGYDPMAPMRNRMAFDGMGPAGAVPGPFLRSDPARLEVLGVRWVQVPASSLGVPPDRNGLGETLDVVVRAGHPRFFPLPFTVASEVRVASLLSEATTLRDGEPVARLTVRLASGRELPLVLRAGLETAEWAYDRPDVRPVVAHGRAPVLETWPVPGQSFLGYRYLATLPLPGRYLVDGLLVERLPGPGQLTISRLGLGDPGPGRGVGAALAAGFLSDSGRFREAVTTPGVRLFEVPNTAERARVAGRARALDGPAEVLAALKGPTALGIDPRREALVLKAEAAGLALPGLDGSRRAQLTQDAPGRLDLRAEGPGLLVVAEGWDPGWGARVDGQPADVLRVNHVQLGVPLPPGMHRVTLRYLPRGFAAGLALAAAGLVTLAAAGRRLARPV